jgi:hypothetical protein
MAETLEDSGIELEEAMFVFEKDPATEAAECLEKLPGSAPLLVRGIDDKLVGILTAFDLL